MIKQRMIGATTKMKKKSGKLKSFDRMFKMQVENQKVMLKKNLYKGLSVNCKNLDLPRDDVELFSYHIKQLMSEIGEVLNADKRWQNFRNGKCDLENKKEEIADCFIVLMNIAMFSGIDCEEMKRSIFDKLAVVSERVQQANAIQSEE